MIFNSEHGETKGQKFQGTTNISNYFDLYNICLF